MYTWLTIDDRKEIQYLLSKGNSLAEIARVLNKNYATIHREISFGGGRKDYDYKHSEAVRQRIRKDSHANKGQAFNKLQVQIDDLREEIEKLKKETKKI